MGSSRDHHNLSELTGFLISAHLMKPTGEIIFTRFFAQTTGNWGLYAIIINSELSLSPNTDTQMLNEGETHVLAYQQKLFPIVHCAYRYSQTKFAADAFVNKRYRSHFHTAKLSVLELPSLDKPKLY